MTMTLAKRKFESERAQVDKEKAIKSYYTTDLTQFEKHTLNRTLRESHIKWLEREMRTHGFNEEYPIRVNREMCPGKLILIAGHHRLEAAKRNKLGVWYCYTTETEPQKDKVEKWTNADVIEMFSKKGLSAYVRAMEWINVTGLAATGFRHIININDMRKLTPHIDSGKMVFTKEQIALLDATQQAVVDVSAALQVPTVGNRFLFMAILSCVRANLYTTDWLSKFRLPSVRTLILETRISTLEEGIKRLEVAINHRNRDTHIYLLNDYQRWFVAHRAKNLGTVKGARK